MKDLDYNVYFIELLLQMVQKWKLLILMSVRCSRVGMVIGKKLNLKTFVLAGIRRIVRE